MEPGCDQDYLEIEGRKYCGYGNQDGKLPSDNLSNVFATDFCFAVQGLSFDVLFRSDDAYQERGFYATFEIRETLVAPPGYDMGNVATNVGVDYIGNFTGRQKGLQVQGTESAKESRNTGMEHTGLGAESKEWDGTKMDFDTQTNDDTCSFDPEKCSEYCFHGHKLDVNACPTCECRVEDSAPCTDAGMVDMLRTCFNRHCINNNVFCDGKDDCGDNSDEDYTHARCTGVGLSRQDVTGCTFQEGLCGSTAANWFRAVESHAGPRFDHTTGLMREGYFMYTSYVIINHAKLVFYELLERTGEDRCLSFWYWMVGDVGRLSVDILTDPEIANPVWTREDDHGPLWIRGQVNIPASVGDISQITFRGTKGLDIDSTIGLDDISIVDGPCYGDDISCTFELDFCGWTNRLDNTVDWIRHKGSTPSLSTGPKHDYVGEGHYIYVEASENSGKHARLVSPPISNWESTSKCLMYQFHMRGEDMGVLRAIILHIDDTESVVLEHDRPKGDKWNMAVASVFTTRPFQIVFEAIVGPGRKSDIAIDNVELKEGGCPRGPRPVQDLSTEAPTRRPNFCRYNEFRCDNGQCIPSIYHCDGRVDCSDHSDEMSCHLRASPAVVALTAIGICILSVIIISAILYNRRKRHSRLERRRPSNVSDIMLAYRNRNNESNVEIYNDAASYTELSADITEPPPVYQSESSERVGRGALGPNLTVSLMFPVEEPPDYDIAVVAKPYIPSTIGPNPPPYTNTLPFTFPKEPSSDNKGYDGPTTDAVNTTGKRDVDAAETTPAATPSSTLRRIKEGKDSTWSPLRALLRRNKTRRGSHDNSASARQSLQSEGSPTARTRGPQQERPSSYHYLTAPGQRSGPEASRARPASVQSAHSDQPASRERPTFRRGETVALSASRSVQEDDFDPSMDIGLGNSSLVHGPDDESEETAATQNVTRNVDRF